MATGKDLLYTMCTAPCVDPQLDCPDEPYAAVCHPLAEDDVVCALPCGPMQPCPRGLQCLTWTGDPVPVCSSLF